MRFRLEYAKYANMLRTKWKQIWLVYACMNMSSRAFAGRRCVFVWRVETKTKKTKNTKKSTEEEEGEKEDEEEEEE